jgi:N-acetylglucosaminyldiphosphoundecaprenol N-acetyl-beta-D-mannosaminyltransferase
MPPAAADIARFKVCGVDIVAADVTTAARTVVDAARTGSALEAHLCNAFTLSLVDGDRELRQALGAADLNLPDGTPVAWLGRGHGLTGPVRGSELVGEVTRVGGPGLRHYLYGGAAGVAELMADRMREHADGTQVVGTECPPYRPLTADDVAGLADRVRDSQADVVWVGLGTPRQDYLVHLLAPLVSRPVVPVGAAFNYWSGTFREAPDWVHGTGFEWAYRLAHEPGRLWRRYLIGNPRFVLSAVRHRLRPHSAD